MDIKKTIRIDGVSKEIKTVYLEDESKVNYLRLPVNNLGNDDQAMEDFNKIVDLMVGFPHLVRTKSGGIKTGREGGIKRHGVGYDVRFTQNAAELTIVGTWQGSCRIQFRNLPKEEGQIYGHQAYARFKSICEEFGIHLEDYFEEDGIKHKEEFKEVPIKVIKAFVCKDPEFDVGWTDAHHIDFNSSYPAGLANTHPVFRPVVEYIYNKRAQIKAIPKELRTAQQNKDNAMYKAIMNFAINGVFQSKWLNYKLTALARDAFNDNVARIDVLTEKLEENGRIPILWNTDGIWYLGDIYHGEGEGKNLGQWQNDHTDCQIRIKSKGCYEYIENGKYTPVVRGRTLLDAVKDRSEWKFGDIFDTRADVIKYALAEDGEHIIKLEEN